MSETVSSVLAPLPERPPLLIRWFGEPVTAPTVFWPRWLFLRGLGLIFFSAFYSLYFQIDGLIGPNGILPAADYLKLVRSAYPFVGYWYAPTVLWLGAGTTAMRVLVWCGMAGSVALTLNLWPRATITVSFVAFLSFIGAAQDFSSYQSDGMLLEAAFLSLFFVPSGLRPRLGLHEPPTRASLFLLQWEWFRVYFESGVVKLASGEPQWRDLTAMDKYYENGPLPTWLGWYVQQWPHPFHAATALLTLVVELFVVLLLFFPKRSRLVCFLIVTPLQIGIILTANYAFLNYLVLLLGVLLLDDELIPSRAGGAIRSAAGKSVTNSARGGWGSARPARILQAIVLTWIFVATVVTFMAPATELIDLPAAALEPFRIANRFGLFAVMTRARYEIEFQGSANGRTWTPYPFRYKPQDVHEAPGIYAPYQPRFDWNLWFASLGTIDQNRWVLNTEVRLLENQAAVLRLFRHNPFASQAPRAVRAVLWQYRFTTAEEKRRTGNWWVRQWRGLWAPAAVRQPDGSVVFGE
jgi:lipase maturation factor 1